MKNIFRLSAFIFILSLFLSIPRSSADLTVPLTDLEPQISMDFKDAGLKDILKAFSMQSGLNFIASEAVQDRKITLYLDKVPLKQAMDRLFKANNLSFEMDDEVNIFIVKDYGKLEVDTITKVFYLKHATVSSSSLKEEMSTIQTSGEEGEDGGGGEDEGKWKTEEDCGITTAIKKLLSGAGSVIEDFRTNSLIVTDTPNRMAVIAQVIVALDVAVPQVMLEVEMLDVSKNVVDAIGIKFSQTPFVVTLGGATESVGFPFKDWGKAFPATAGMGTWGINATNTYSAQLDFLRTQTDTKYLARPRVLTLNNETAEIKITTNEAIGIETTTEATSGTTSAEAERYETGVSLRITPQIDLDRNEVTMFVYPRVSDATSSSTLISGGLTYSFRDPETRSTKTTVKVKDGETVIIGGLIRNQKTEVITKLPILGDMPIVGALFRHKKVEPGKDRELLVFITPHIIREDKEGIKLAQTKKAALPEREQNTVSMFDREAVVSSSLNEFE
ncbi:MAG: type II secretion system protein GspD [Candidatus Omnitrophica bacterium]|nr:type II secretion system protein GspD [Candidatus Omnitrophota bacterium]